MNKTIKGAGAAVAAGVLLLGGAGSLAYWTGEAEVEGASVNSGELKLTNPGCEATWSLNGGTYTDPVADDPATPLTNESSPGTLIVPGDTLTKSCTYTVVATGENIEAALAATAPAESGAAELIAELDASGSSFTVGGAAVSSITEADNGKSLVATINVDFPYGAATDDSQALLATLGSYTVTATQTDATP